MQKESDDGIDADLLAADLHPVHTNLLCAVAAGTEAVVAHLALYRHITGYGRRKTADIARILLCDAIARKFI